MSLTLFIQAPNEWDKVSEALLALTRNMASEVRFLGSHADISADPAVVEVVVMELNGEADHALEIFWKGLTELAADSVGMYLAHALESPVLAPHTNPSSSACWLRLLPGGMIEEIELDMSKLNDDSTVAYRAR